MPEQKPKPTREFVTAVALAFEKYAPDLHRYVRRRVRNPATVPDLTQEIFERFLQVPPTETVRNTQGFLYGIAFNVVSEYRYRQANSVISFDSDAVDSASERLEHAIPDDVAERLAMHQELRFALQKLPPVHRAVLLLVKREGLSYAEVAKKTGLEESTVTKYVFEARARVKQLLKRAER
jgi:RNA polymerase sigma-70 factor (ECF subfamily)